MEKPDKEILNVVENGLILGEKFENYYRSQLIEFFFILKDELEKNFNYKQDFGSIII